MRAAGINGCDQNGQHVEITRIADAIQTIAGVNYLQIDVTLECPRSNPRTNAFSAAASGGFARCEILCRRSNGSAVVAETTGLTGEGFRLPTLLLSSPQVKLTC
jgi:hypothetical protein